jgi:hypothetical protein
MVCQYTDRSSFIHSFIHSFHWHVQNASIPCRSQELLPFLSIMYFFLPPFSPPTSLPSSLISSCQLFLGLPLSLTVSKFIPNTFLGILFSSIICTCPNQRNECNLIVSVIVGFLTTAQMSLLVNLLAPELFF